MLLNNQESQKQGGSLFWFLYNRKFRVATAAVSVVRRIFCRNRELNGGSSAFFGLCALSFPLPTLPTIYLASRIVNDVYLAADDSKRRYIGKKWGLLYSSQLLDFNGVS